MRMSGRRSRRKDVDDAVRCSVPSLIVLSVSDNNSNLSQSQCFVGILLPG